MTQRAAGKRGAIPRVIKKARRAERTALDREFNSELAVILRGMETAKAAARADFEATVSKARTKMREALLQAERDANDGREKLLKRLRAKVAPTEEEEAAV